jgi:hypothetical protein
VVSGSAHASQAFGRFWLMVGCLAVVTIAAYMGLTMIQESQQNLY